MHPVRSDMADGFNPYHEWLGLAADVVNPNYYELLGLPEREPDLEKIALAGDRAMTRVRSFRPGANARMWSELLDQIFAAKTCLLEPEIKAAYDQRLERGNLAASLGKEHPYQTAVPARAPVDVDRYPPGMAPPGTKAPAPRKIEPPAVAPEEVIAATAVPAWEQEPAAGPYEPAYAVPMAQPYASAAAPYAAMPASAAPMAHFGTPGAASLDPMAPVSIPGLSGRGPSDGSPQQIVGFAGAIEPQPVVAMAYGPVALPVGTAVAPVTPVPSSGPSVGGELATRREAQARWNLVLAGVGVAAAVLAALIIYVNLPADSDDGDEPTVAQVNPPGSPQPMPRAVESTLPTGKPTPIPATVPQPTLAPSPMPATAPMLPSPVPTPLPETPQPEPMPAAALPTPEPAPVVLPPAPLPPQPMPTPTELAALGKALTLGRAALGEQNFDEADKYIAEAQSLARTSEHQAMAARLKEVAGYVRQFRQAVELAAQDFEAAETFMVGSSTRVAVVEVLPDKIILRHTGQNKIYPYAELPPGLAVAIADHKLDGMDPVSRVIKGSFYAVSKGDRVALHQKAKIWWEEAQLGGVDLIHLMPFLTDNYDLVGTNR